MLFSTIQSQRWLCRWETEVLTVVRRTRDVNQFNRWVGRRLDLRRSAKVMRCDLGLEIVEKFRKGSCKNVLNFLCGYFGHPSCCHMIRAKVGNCGLRFRDEA